MRKRGFRWPRPDAVAASALLFAVSACAESPLREGGSTAGGIRPIASATTLVRMGSGPEGLARFEPRVEPRYDGGECTSEDAPLTEGRALTAYYPRRDGAHTSVSITVGDDGRILRYVENRGLPERSSDPAVMGERVMSTPRTFVQLDYDTGAASVMNMGDGASDGVRGRVDDFVRSPVLGDLNARLGAVLDLCAPDRDASAPLPFPR